MHVDDTVMMVDVANSREKRQEETQNTTSLHRSQENEISLGQEAEG